MRTSDPTPEMDLNPTIPLAVGKIIPCLVWISPKTRKKAFKFVPAINSEEMMID